MKLTRTEALKIFRELWTWCAETGMDKIEWPGWIFNGGKTTTMLHSCPLCEFTKQNANKFCRKNCLVIWPAGVCCTIKLKTSYDRWWSTLACGDIIGAKRYAGMIATLPARELSDAEQEFLAIKHLKKKRQRAINNIRYHLKKISYEQLRESSRFLVEYLEAKNKTQQLSSQEDNNDKS